MAATRPDTSDLAATVAAHPFAAGLDRSHVEAMAAAATVRRFAAGTFVFRHGAPATAFHLVVDGRVALEVADPGHGSIVVETLAAGEPLGWSWLFPHRTWAFDARAVVDTRTVAIDADRLRGMIEEDAPFGRELALRIGRVAVDRLLHTRAQLVDAHHHAAR
jgi:CRP/FNR family cyclic AMP-dependent transcriptional regulator